MGRLSFDKERFDTKLAEIMDEQPASHLLSVPGVYEIIVEHFNNAVLDALRDALRDEDEADEAAMLRSEEEI